MYLCLLCVCKQTNLYLVALFRPGKCECEGYRTGHAFKHIVVVCVRRYF